MGSHSEVEAFLTTHRESITPEQAGLRRWDVERQAAGLRREEVALLAGISTDYYARLERGNLRGVPTRVLEALGRVLHLDDAGQAYLIRLAATADATDHRP
jgi:predicted transcriptional regulator